MAWLAFFRPGARAATYIRRSWEDGALPNNRAISQRTGAKGVAGRHALLQPGRLLIVVGDATRVGRASESRREERARPGTETRGRAPLFGLPSAGVVISRAASYREPSGRRVVDRMADHWLTSLWRTALEPSDVSIRPIRQLRAVPKACPNEVARAVFWWLVVARTGRSKARPIA